jgi:hypothetical protein
MEIKLSMPDGVMKNPFLNTNLFVTTWHFTLQGSNVLLTGKEFCRSRGNFMADG